MYSSSVLMLLSWPAVILISWLAVRYVLVLYEKKQQKIARKADDKT